MKKSGINPKIISTIIYIVLFDTYLSVCERNVSLIFISGFVCVVYVCVVMNHIIDCFYFYSPFLFRVSIIFVFLQQCQILPPVIASLTHFHWQTDYNFQTVSLSLFKRLNHYILSLFSYNFQAILCLISIILTPLYSHLQFKIEQCAI